MFSNMEHIILLSIYFLNRASPASDLENKSSNGAILRTTGDFNDSHQRHNDRRSAASSAFNAAGAQPEQE
jgi:hypothetical protein